MRLSEDARRCVVFFAVPSPHVEGEVEYGGTGFLVALKDGDSHFGYLVTAGHVARTLQKFEDTGFFLRVNKKDGPATLLPIEKINWHFSDKTKDVAVSEYQLSSSLYDQVFLNLGSVLASDDYKIVCGDGIAIVGLFRLRVGTQRNVPVVHNGTIAAQADEQEPVPVRDRVTDELLEMVVHLVEAQTLDGLSGSPVFIEESIDLAVLGSIGNEDEKPVYAKSAGRAFLIGVYSGSWDGEPGAILARERNLKGGDRVPVGMGLVTPFSEVMKIIEGDAELKVLREIRKAMRAGQHAATTDSAFSDHQPTDENPKGREDFSSLLNAAAQKQKPDGQT